MLPAVLERAVVHSPIRLGQCPLAMHFTSEPLAFIHGAIGPVIGPSALHLFFEELPFVPGAILPFEKPITMLGTRLKGTSVLANCAERQCAQSMVASLQEASHIAVSVGLVQASLPFFNRVTPLPRVDAPISKYLAPDPVGLIIEPVAFVDGAV